MYYYVVDPQNLNQRQFERVQNQLYSCLSQYRINGETSRVTSLRTVQQLVDLGLSHGAKTLVAVGSDETLMDLVNALKGREAIIGFIPLTETEMGSVLGIADVASGCKTIAGRRIMLFDLGMVNHPPRVDERTPASSEAKRGERVEAGTAFLTRLSFGVNLPKKAFPSLEGFKQLFKLPTFEIKFSTSDYKAVLKVLGGQIVNSRSAAHKNPALASPIDGMLDVLLLPRLPAWSLIKFKNQIASGNFDQIPGSSLLHLDRLEISAPDGLPLRVGARIVAKTPAVIEVLPRRLKIISGKDRLF